MMCAKLFFVLIIMCLNVVSEPVESAVTQRRLRSVIEAIFDPAPPQEPDNDVPIIGCVGCKTKYTKTIEATGSTAQMLSTNKDAERFTVTEQEITALRIEYIKKQILRKLRLKEKPHVTLSSLPEPITENNNILPQIADEYETDLYPEDFYGKTTQAIIFPYEDDARCVRKIRNPSACIPFQMPNDIHPSDVKSAELWFHKEADILDLHNQTFVISEVAHWDSNRSFQKMKPIAIQETNLSAGWLKVDVAYIIKLWLKYPETPTRAINVACKTCGMQVDLSPISFQPSLKPFLVINTYSQHHFAPQPRRRLRRHISMNCGPGSTECCRESLYVSFAEIGWDDWIIDPPGYNAYFCKGACNTLVSMIVSATDHNNVLNKVMFGSNRNSAQRLELNPCCAATHFQPLQLLVISNKTISKKFLSNMIVDSCGCM